MPRRGRQRKKSRTQEVSEASAASALTTVEKIPKSLIIRRGKTCPELVELIKDMRRMMLPYTALNFKEDPKNRKLTLQQYATHLALPMGITHILQFSQTAGGERIQLRLGRLPAGPVLHFRVHQFSLSRDILKLQRRPMSTTSASMTQHSAITVTNNFAGGGGVGGGAAAGGGFAAGGPPPHVKLMNITFQNLFPQINVSTVQLHECKRVVLFDRNETTGRVQMRHYAITTKSVNVHKRLQRLERATHLPNLHKCQDIADYLEAGYRSDGGCGYKSDYASDDDDEDARTFVSTATSTKVQSALKLVELGPRLELELIKVEKDLEKSTTVLYHAELTAEQLAERAAAVQRQQAVKAERQRVQEDNVERKEAERKRKRDKKKMRRPLPAATTEEGQDGQSEDGSDGEEEDEESENE